MEVKPGYKLTEVGVIPEDWEVIKLGERAVFKTGPFGSALHKSDYTENGIPWINPIHIVDGQLIPDKRVTITEEAAKLLHDFKLRSSDIIIARRGDMGRCAVVQEGQVGWICGSGSMIIRCTPRTIPDFVQRVLASPRAIADLENASVGSTMNNLNQGVLGNLKIQCPPTIAEQRTIAEALSDVDALLAALDQLIAKQRDLKQATMQQLLTGQTRLPGFTGEWEVKWLSDIVDFANGKPHEGHIDTMGCYYLITLDSIGIDGELKADHRLIGFLDNSLAKDDIVIILSDIAHGNLLGLCDLIPEDNRYVLNQRVGRLRIKADVEASPQFLRRQINRHQYHFKKRGQGTSQRHIYRRDIDQLQIEMPLLPEQTAIAAVLADMDAELTALEQRRAKTRLLKQAMMQELLTGRTRLVG